MTHKHAQEDGPLPLGSNDFVRPENPLPADDWGRWRGIRTAAETHSIKVQKEWDKYVRLFRDGEFNREPGDKSMKVSANFTFSYITMMMAMLYAESPSIEVEPRDDVSGPADQAFLPLIQVGLFPSPAEAKVRFADVIERQLTHSYDETSSHRHNLAALFDLLVRGMGVTKESWDETRGLDRCDAIRRDELYLDPNARFIIQQAKYALHVNVMQVDDARAFFEARGVSPRFIEPNHDLTDGDTLRAQRVKESVSTEKAKDYFKFYEAWWKDGDARRLDYLPYKSDGWITRMEWPFELDADDFPFTLWVFHQQYASVNDAFSDRHVVDPLRQVIEEVMEFAHKQTRRSMAKKVLVDKSALGPEMAELNELMDPETMKFVPLDAKNKSLGDLVHLLDFNSAVDPSVDLATVFKQAREEVEGLDELLRGMADKKMTAEEASIREKYGSQRTGFKQRQVDAALTTQCRHRAMIARQLVAPETVASVAGMDAALLWQLYAGNPQDLVSEFSIGIAAGSTGERAKQKRMERMERMYQRAVGENQAALSIGMIPPYDTQKMAEDIWREDGIRRPDKYRTPMAGQPIPMPQAPPVAVPAEEGAPPNVA